ncbi:MAG: ABC transporter substrate-binding protein [Candidatus Syntrophopropionicum ammoniitolerans]
MLANLRSTNPDMIFATSYVMDASMIVKQMKELNFDTKLFVGNGAGYTMPEFYQNAGAASDFVASTSLWVLNVSWQGASEYYEKYKQKYGKEPDYHGAQAYATMYVIADALNRAEDLSNTGIQSALKDTDIQTIMGRLSLLTGQALPIRTNQTHMLCNGQMGSWRLYGRKRLSPPTMFTPSQNGARDKQT